MLFVQYGAVKCSAVQCSAVQWYIASVQVRKTSQAALLVLLEQGLADIQDVEEQVITACPAVRLSCSSVPQV